MYCHNRRGYNTCYISLLQQTLTLFKMKLGTVIIYIKETLKIYESRREKSLEFC